MEQAADAHSRTRLAAQAAVHAAVEAPAAARAVDGGCAVAVWLMAFRDVVEAQAAMHTANLTPAAARAVVAAPVAA